MVRYIYAWIPVVFVGAIFILSLPWLGLIALTVALAAVAPLALSIVYVPYRLGQAMSRRGHGLDGAAWRQTLIVDAFGHEHAARPGVAQRTPRPAPSAVSIGAGDGVAAGRSTLRKEHQS